MWTLLNQRNVKNKYTEAHSKTRNHPYEFGAMEQSAYMLDIFVKRGTAVLPWGTWITTCITGMLILEQATWRWPWEK